MKKTVLGFLLLLAASGGIVPLMAQPAPDSAGAELVGTIAGPDGKTPLPGAVVRAYHLSSERAFTSEPTGSKGRFQFTDLPYGYFDLAVETSDGLFVANQVVNLPPQGKASVSLVLRSFSGGALPEGQSRAFPGVEADPAGQALVQKRLGGRDFWRSPKGVAIVATGGAVTLLAIAGGGSSEPNASPDSP